MLLADSFAVMRKNTYTASGGRSFSKLCPTAGGGADYTPRLG